MPSDEGRTRSHPQFLDERILLSGNLTRGLWLATSTASMHGTSACAAAPWHDDPAPALPTKCPAHSSLK
jgi:hypothetical protein